MDEHAQELDLRRYLGILRRRKAVIALTAVGMVTAALVASFLQDPVYQASAEILLQPRASESVFSSSDGAPAQSSTVETEVRVITSDPVRAAVREKLGTAPQISASRVGETEVMVLQALSAHPRRAAAIANAYANAYVEFRRRQAVDDLLSAGQAIQTKIDAIRSEIRTLDQQLAQTASEERRAIGTGARQRLENLLTQQGLLQQKLDQLQVDAALKTGGAQLVRVASTPSSPARPKPVRNGIAALAAGLVVGVGLAFLRDHLDDSIKTKEDLSWAVDEIPVLGVIPRIEDVKSGVPQPVDEHTSRSHSPAIEAYRSLRTSVQLLGIDRPLKTVQITSPMASEGKTNTVVNLAVVLAAAGQRVVMVDCDLRRPRLHDVFHVSGTVGFTSAFLGDVSLTDAIRPIPGERNLFLLPSGRIPANPSEVLSSKRTSELLFELQTEFDMVVIDSAPVLPVTDATVLAAWVEATLLVARAGLTTRKQLSDAVTLVRQVNASLVGTVLNEASEGASYGYGYRDKENGHRSRNDRRRRLARSRAKARIE